MNFSTLIPTLTSIAGGIIVGIIGYFLKRTIALVDKCEQGIQRIEDTKATKSEVESLKTDIKEKTDKLCRDIESIKEDYITKEDFFRELSKIDRQLTRIVDILLERKGDTNG